MRGVHHARRRSPAPSQLAASEAVPTPASTITGTFACSTIRRMLTGFCTPSPEPIGAAKRHDGGGAQLLQPLRHQRIVAAIDHHLEAFADQHLGRAQGLDHVGIQRLAVAQNFKLHQRPAARLAREPQGAHRVFAGEAAGGIGQIGDFLRIDEIDQLAAAPDR